MGLNKTEINLLRLLAAAPNQTNQAKLIHYVATMREQLEQLAAETTTEGLPSVSKVKLNEYAEKIEGVAAILASQPDHSARVETEDEIKNAEGTSERQETSSVKSPSDGLRRRLVAQDSMSTESSPAIKLDAAAEAHIEKHRKLQDDLTDELVVLARQLKEGSLVMNQSLKETEKILDSTENALEHSLAATGHANVRATEVYSRSFKTTCFTWLLIFIMSCMFVMVVLLIRIT